MSTTRTLVAARPRLTGAASRIRAAAWAATTIGVVGQIAYPLCSDRARDMLTVLTVIAFFIAAAGAVIARQGARAAVVVLALAALTLVVEAVGVRTGFPFGRYHYTGRLGPTIASVPVIVGLAWTALGLCAAGVGRLLAPRGSAALAALIGGIALAGWDLFLDPQMVSEGHWQWTGGGPDLPGSGGIPLTNLAGWIVVGIAVAGIAQRSLPPLDGRDAILATIFGWTYFSEVLGNAAFFHRPAVAVLGGLGLGVVAIPYFARLAARAGNGPGSMRAKVAARVSAVRYR